MARAIVIAAWGIAGAGHSEPVAAQDSGLQGARRTGARQVRIASERDGILQAVSGLTCECDELMEKKKDDGRGFVKDKRVVYIYHKHRRCDRPRRQNRRAYV
jgi:PglZ domain